MSRKSKEMQHKLKPTNLDLLWYQMEHAWMGWNESKLEFSLKFPLNNEIWLGL